MEELRKEIETLQEEMRKKDEELTQLRRKDEESTESEGKSPPRKKGRIESYYQFKIYPIVGEHQTDGRKNKESGYVIVRLVNERTVAVFELKLEVARAITGAAKDDLSQLFYEGKLVCKSDKNFYEKLICVYANHNDWHVFVMDYSGVLLRCKEYHSFQHLHEDSVCKLIVDLVRRID